MSSPFACKTVLYSKETGWEVKIETQYATLAESQTAEFPSVRRVNLQGAVPCPLVPVAQRGVAPLKTTKFPSSCILATILSPVLKQCPVLKLSPAQRVLPWSKQGSDAPIQWLMRKLLEVQRTAKRTTKASVFIILDQKIQQGQSLEDLWGLEKAAVFSTHIFDRGTVVGCLCLFQQFFFSFTLLSPKVTRILNIIISDNTNKWASKENSQGRNETHFRVGRGKMACLPENRKKVGPSCKIMALWETSKQKRASGGSKLTKTAQNKSFLITLLNVLTFSKQKYCLQRLVINRQYSKIKPSISLL